MKYCLYRSHWVTLYDTTSVDFVHPVCKGGCTGKYFKSTQLKDLIVLCPNIEMTLSTFMKKLSLFL